MLQLNLMELTEKYIKSILHYEKETGDWTWLVQKSNRIKPGQLAGALSGGYWIISVDFKRIRSHRLAFLYVTGEWPKNDVDHINGNKLDNRWCNLREATDKQNQANRKLNKDNKTGYKGVKYKRNRWEVTLGLDGKKVYFGRYKTLRKAVEAYNRAAIKHFGEFARINPIPPHL